MMKLAVISTVLCSAAAFAPAPQAKAASALSSYEGEVGVTAPLGFYDPFGYVDGVSQERFDNIRETEIKHGRVAMLAVTGYLITANGIRFPGAEDIPDGLAAFPALMAKADGKMVLFQMLAFFAVAEMVNRDAFGLAAFPGDYRNGALDFGWDKLSEETKIKKRNTELNQGRAAMMGITGLVIHEAMGVSILPGGYLPGQ
eukprot:CAMPEP_0119013164 /NCGR_PEP_ID=MMETSP1176-20130426/8055_1 /TAXON_ID=265551 /ORGANISM="Synedropsis recta cf, Strain CCMP1620" /LENGTH=199 /DNA_ID=CAMNT_0006966223 /DNA_START=28 /DNA_END=627 /DNA_ORIENTATION=+